MGVPTVSAVSYRFGVKEPEGWDVLHVRFLGVNAATKAEMVLNSLVIARDRAGSIHRKTDLLYDWWETVTDEGDRRDFQWHFDERDRLVAKRRS
jgi:hypothetical protein